MPYELLSAFGRRLRWGMVGGGNDSLIGDVHRLAARLDNRYELIAGALSVDPAVAHRTAAEALIEPGRSYADWREMAENESGRADGVEVITVATPPHLHAEVSKAFLSRGIDVLCEKPMTRTLEEALDLEACVTASGRLFAVTHCYTGYPLVREARALVADGAIGEVRQVECDFPSGPFLTEHPDRTKRHWRFRPEFMGKDAILGELGAHSFGMAHYVTGQEPVAVSANMAILTDGRETYDDAQLTLKYADGAFGRMWLSFVAAGNEHGLSFRIHGTKGALVWRQQQPELLVLQHAHKPAEMITPGFPDRMTPYGYHACRLREGHPEGYVLAFANLYRDFADSLIARKLDRAGDTSLMHYPTINDGVHAMRMHDAAARSAERDGAWVRL